MLKWAGVIYLDNQVAFSYLICMRKIFLIILLTLSTLLPFPANRDGMAGDKITVGAIEEVVLLPWGVRMPARIDTGAATSSLDARDLKIKKGMVEFKLPDKYGGLKLNLRVVDRRVVKSAQTKKRRPVVEMDLCLGPKRVRTEVNLADRSGLTYPMIIGRNVLRENYVVDCELETCQVPTCPEVPQK